MRVLPRSRLVTAADLLLAEQAGAAGRARRREHRLAALVASARAHAPFFAKHYRGLSEAPTLQDLPPTAKAPLMAAFDDWLTDRRISRAGVERFLADPARIGTLLEGRYLAWTSSGTTGHPGRFLQDAAARGLYRALSTRIDRAWLTPQVWRGLLRRRFRWVSVLATGGHFAGESWMAHERRRSAWRRWTYQVLPVQQATARLVQALNEADPAIVTLYPSTALVLAEEQRAGRLRLAPALLELSGESATLEETALLQATFGAPVHQVYACSETMLIGASCREGWLHVNDDWVVLEPVEADLRPTPAGTASHSVLLTNLANRVQPILRYDLGDSVLASPVACPCGNPLPAVRVLGRRDDVLTLGEGAGAVRVSPIALSALLSRTSALRRAQLVQTGTSALEVRLEPRESVTRHEAWRALEPALRALLDELGAAGVALALAPDPPRPEPRSGKLRQVLARRA